jgi:hypothetical protein
VANFPDPEFRYRSTAGCIPSHLRCSPSRLRPNRIPLRDPSRHHGAVAFECRRHGRIKARASRASSGFRKQKSQNPASGDGLAIAWLSLLHFLHSAASPRLRLFCAEFPYPEFRYRFTPGFILSHLRCFPSRLRPNRIPLRDSSPHNGVVAFECRRDVGLKPGASRASSGFIREIPKTPTGVTESSVGRDGASPATSHCPVPLVPKLHLGTDAVSRKLNFHQSYCGCQLQLGNEKTREPENFGTTG